MNDIVIHVVGHIGTDVEFKMLAGGGQVSNFRLAATPRHYSKARRGFVDEVTNWISVECWRSLALNVSKSLHRGQPVVVVGKLKTQEWTKDGVRHSRFILEAISVGHDLSRGIATFTKVVHASEPYSGGAEETSQAGREVGERAPLDIEEAIASAHDDGRIERFLADAS